MNVFRKKGKAKDDGYVIPPATPVSSESPPLSKISRSLKRKQKNVVETKPEIDLATALPDSNDFRTSLLMPGLSARFSMLREQDDPSTLVGKANDDSVLFPKRASRMNLFSHNPLTDIAEVHSIHSTVRAPFAEAERSQSFSEGVGANGDDAGGAFARTKGVEGNNLFGGRQKMYRIANASSSRDLVEMSTPLTTKRHLYQDDVILSPYQEAQLRAREQEERDGSQGRPLSDTTEAHDSSSVVNTPSTGFSKSRGTISSTASGPSNRRTSTAATSVVSDSPAPRQSNASSSSNARIRGSDFDSEENPLRQKLSSDSRRPGHAFESQDQPPLPPSPVSTRQISLSRSATNLSEKRAVGASPSLTGGMRAVSPPPAARGHVAPLDFGLKATKSQLRRYQTASPTHEDEGDSEVYHQSLEPNDRGKATAMGLFNRPRQQFDEQKFQERQLQMHQGKNSLPHTNNSDKDAIAGSRHHAEEISTSTNPASPTTSSFNTSSTGRARSQSSASASPAQVHAQVEALIRRQNEEYTALQMGESTTADPNPALPKPKSVDDQLAASSGTFFDTFDGSDEEEGEVDMDSPMLGRYEPTPILASGDVHPALRDASGTQAFDFGEQVAASIQTARSRSNTSVEDSSPAVTHDTPDTSDSLHPSESKELDSPTLGPVAGLGLSGMIRTHLRHDSDKSSVMPPPSPALGHKQPSGFPGFRDREPSVASTARTTNPPESTHSDPWEFDNAHRPQRSPLEAPATDPTTIMSQRAQQILGQAISLRNNAAVTQAQSNGDSQPPPDDEHPANRQWDADMVHSHQRGESTETQKEFDNELAERARKIQEGLKNVVEAEKRSRSPAPGYDRPNPAAQALQVLRHKASKTALAPRVNDSQPKAMKTLGLGVIPKSDIASRSPNVQSRGDHGFEQGYENAGTGFVPRERPSDFEHPGGRRTPGFGRPMGNTHDRYAEYQRSRQRSATPSGRAPRGERGGPEPGERSRSRPARHREEHQHDPLPGWEQDRSYGPPRAQQGPRPFHAAQRGPPPVEVRNYERSGSAMSDRRPSASRPEASPYLDERAGTPTLAGTPQLGTGQSAPTINAPRPSPRPPFPHSPMSQFSQPGLSPSLSGPPSAGQSALPSPVGPLPPVPSNGRSTPVDGRSTPLGARKKSVTKGMISEPTFISSTSSVPLVGLPRGPRPSQIATPPIPAMNPRRRGNTMHEGSDARPSPQTVQSAGPAMPESLGRAGFGFGSEKREQQQQQPQQPVPRQRNRLRKISSEGGNMAARARQQAMLSEFGQERLRSPALPVFPNRSATSLGVHQDGGMF
ncbi:hypothetical protein ABEF95_008145 [Exophiala dermatitidis]